MAVEESKTLENEVLPTPREFGRAGAIIGFILGGLLLLRQSPTAPYVFLGGAVLYFLGRWLPTVLAPISGGWTRAARVIGELISQLILILFYICVLTPVALVARIWGKRFLDVAVDKSTASYWRHRVISSSEYERQF
ncbi:hypothetical protein A3D72_04190 [Candidatus Uhrbacteria bacterium RIFCSPHIGHO2_02_FULL_57_19]|uniref:SxtJ n=2 Tax=Parcubacteria group TaxID=1794811 RepID=A0A1F6CQM6_9BACT|nr:MAG: hypothetical protein A2704_04610 [Candidatus Kaiserbacteria bacterium RIFCSPHIGHO2_01_FULL_54_36b]OGL72741.1 MAG: hypothetical protein A3D72_04190 [Candidatus Uhrbacteria bacterium RIFCSPHIGHO2_02_FULL_57_19]